MSSPSTPTAPHHQIPPPEDRIPNAPRKSPRINSPSTPTSKRHQIPPPEDRIPKTPKR